MSVRFILGLLIGMAIGAAVALALAPQGGTATREQLIEKAKERVSGMTR